MTDTKQNKQEIKTLELDEKGTISISHVGERKVECNLTAKPDSKSPVRYQMKWSFDFSSCSPQEVEEIAANYLKIRQQDAWRKDADYNDATKYNDVTFDVKEIMSRTRVNRSNPVAKAKKLLEAMSEDARAELLKQLA